MTELLDQETGEPGILVGKRLRAAREAQGFSIQELARRLCLGARQIEALENGDLDKLPGKTFIRGIVRNYAGIVHLEAEPLLALLDQIKNLVTPKLTLPESTHAVIPTVQQATSGNQNGLIAAAIILVTVAVTLYFLAPFLDLSRIWNNGQSEASRHDPAPELPVKEPFAEDGISAAPSTLPAEDTESMTPAKEGPRTLQFLFSGEAWVEVRDKDNRILVSGRFAAEQTQVVNGWPPFSVTVGDTTRVQLYDDGKEVPLKPSGETRTARVRLP